METWKPIAFAEGYEVSDRGRVRSWRRWGGRSGPCVGHTSRLLSLKTDRDGYLVASLYVNSAMRQVRVHRLVALAFIGEPPPGKNEVRHLDGDPTNNAADNLAWGDAAANARDKVQHGRSVKGTGSPHAKLTESDIPRVAAWRAAGLTYGQIAARLNVSASAVGRVVRGEGWRHATQVTEG